MTPTSVLAIDQGTSGTKAVVIDPGDGVVAEAEVPLYPDYLPDGGVEQDPQALLDSVLAAGRQAIADAKRPVGLLALANQGETVLAWDRDTGRPLSPAIVWQDRRAGQLCDELAEHADMLAARTGLVLDPYFSAPKMTWLRRHLTTAGVVTTTDSWLVLQLCGEFVTDASTASRSLLLAGALLAEQNDEWLVQRRYLSVESMALILSAGWTEENSLEQQHQHQEAATLNAG